MNKMSNFDKIIVASERSMKIGEQRNFSVVSTRYT